VKQALTGAAAELSERRNENEKRSAAWNAGAREDAETENGLFQAETTELRNRRQALAKEREDLVERLKVIDGELEAVSHQEETLELKVRQDSAAKASRRHADERMRLLNATVAASHEVEALIRQRLQEAETFGQECTGLNDRSSTLQQAYLQAERLRRRGLEELIAGVHAATWGPESDALVEDPAALATIRALLVRVSTLLEQAWKEAVQLAAETLGIDSGNGGAISEAMTRAASRYKEMKLEMDKTSARLVKLERAQFVGGGGGSSSAAAAQS
jgi:hypothetical protein